MSTKITHTICLCRCGPMTRYWCMRFEGKHNYFKDLAHHIKQFKNIAMSLSHRHQQLVCYQLSKPESLVKILETAKCAYQLFNTVLACIFIGHPCKVKELEYCEFLPQACSLLNEESEIHKYVCTYVHIAQKFDEGRF